MLSRGYVVYSGETRLCLPYFARLGYQPHEQTNPLDFLIDISSIDTRDDNEEAESRERVARLVRCWREHEIVVKEREEGEELEAETGDSSSSSSSDDDNEVEEKAGEAADKGKATLKDARDRQSQLNRRHRGLMQWSGMRKMHWVGHNIEDKFDTAGQKIKGAFKHNPMEGQVEHEV